MADNNQVIQFDGTKLIQDVKERIKGTFTSLIPEDKWEQLVQAEIDAFFNPTTPAKITVDIENVSYTNYKKYKLQIEGQISPFRQLVWDMALQKCAVLLQEEVFSKYLGKPYETQSEEIKAGLTEMIAQAAPKVMESFFRGIAFNAVMPVQQQMNDFINQNNYR